MKSHRKETYEGREADDAADQPDQEDHEVHPTLCPLGGVVDGVMDGLVPAIFFIDAIFIRKNVT